jgi:hypothetical protein
MDKTSWPTSGVFAGWITGYELDGAIERGEFQLDSCYGWIMEGPSGGSLSKYVDTFYEQKRNATDPTERTVSKLFLNSLYGKFFQKIPNGTVGSVDIETNEFITTDPEEDYDWIAGGLYHPPIASLITGYVRAKIHRLEHRYESMMTSTDGFFARKLPDPGEIGNELGQLSAERGTLRIWRERLYVFDADDGSVTFAMHGFRGNLETLRRIPMKAGNLYHYMARAVVTLKMSTRAMRGQRYAPGTFVEMPFDLALPGPAP